MQGTDWIYRMIPHWSTFIEEVKELKNNKAITEFINSEALHSALINAEEGPHPEQFTNSNYSLLMRSLIVNRFIKKFN